MATKNYGRTMEMSTAAPIMPVKVSKNILRDSEDDM